MEFILLLSEFRCRSTGFAVTTHSNSSDSFFNNPSLETHWVKYVKGVFELWKTYDELQKNTMSNSLIIWKKTIKKLLILSFLNDYKSKYFNKFCLKFSIRKSYITFFVFIYLFFLSFSISYIFAQLFLYSDHCLFFCFMFLKVLQWTYYKIVVLQLRMYPWWPPGSNGR